MSDFLCFGDFISLYCEENEGYVYNVQTSSAFNSIYVYQWQDREKPKHVPCPQAIQFQVCIQNRYKLNKKYRKLLQLCGEGQDNLETRAQKAQAKFAADAENDDNVAEQKRQHGKRVRYGEIIQLKHVFTEKFIHISTTTTSRRDKNNMLVHLLDYNGKHAQLKILPRYKVKTEGESVQIFDQIIFESVKSPGQFFHVGSSWKIDNFSVGSELNLGVQPAGFTLVKCYRHSEEQKEYLRGGSVIRLFHKELEAFVVAEGLFDDEVTEDVHLRIREVDQLVPKSLYPTTSANTFWQVETETSLLNGDVIRWEQQIRFRHLTTRQYLCITTDRKVTLTSDSNDPRTVFRVHPVIKAKEVDEIIFDSYARIEHVITGYWLHAMRDEEYVRRQLRQTENESGESLKSLRWDAASLRKISASGEKVYHDAYTLQVVEPANMSAFNYAAGMVPFLLNHIIDRNLGKILNAKKTFKITQALEELKNFMIIKGIASKKRQKLMRNLRIIDLLVRVLQFPLQGASDQTHLTKIFKGAYDVLYTYMIGNSRKNALYFAKYIDFFQTQITVKVGDIGLNVAKMIAELIRDNRKIVDRISQEQIELFVGLLKLNKNYRYLDLLNVLCVCNGVAIPNNQTYITEHWLRRDKVGMRFLTERGQNVNGQPNIIYVSKNNGVTWDPLHEFVDKESSSFNEEDEIFFEHQLELYGNLCYGRNDFSIFVITRELGILTWDEAFLSLRSVLLPDSLRAKYCDLIIGLYIDVGTNYSVLDHTNLSFIYEDILSPGPNVDGEFVKKSIPAIENWLAPEGIIKDLVTLFPVIRDWIAEFLLDIKEMIASQRGHNMLIEQVLRLFHFLVKFGYYGSEDIKKLLKPLLIILDCKHDKPFLPDTDKGFSKEAQKIVQLYRSKDRFEPSKECEALVNAKYQAMEVLDLLLTFQFNSRLESFIAKFKTSELAANKLKGIHSILCPLLDENFDPFDLSKRGLNLQRKAVKDLKYMFESTAYFDSEQITSILMDLSNYKYDKMINKSLSLLNKFYSAKTKLFKLAIRAMVLITTDSCHVHREVARTMPILRRYSKAKLNDDQVKSMGSVLDTYTGFCQIPKEDTERNPMNQNILINHEVLTLVFDMLTSEIDAKLMEQYRGLEVILKKCLRLLKALARGNEFVQMRIFERLDILLKIKVVESEVAIALKEAFIGNQRTCLKILPQQIQNIVDLIGSLQDRAGAEFLDLLKAIVKVEGLGLTLKRNQAYVMKYVMQDYNKLAAVMDQPREIREEILTLGTDVNQLKYLISLVDLLATCAEGENRFIESMCQTIMSVDELLWVMNHPEISNNLKRPFMTYFLWVYMKTAGSAVESGAGDLPHDLSLWNFLVHLSKDLHQLTEYISKQPDKAMQLLKKIPEKCSVAEENDADSIFFHNVHYIFDAVMPILQAFYTKFYQPEKDTHPEEIENTDKLSRTLVGFCEAAIPLISDPGYNKNIISCISAIIPSSTVPISIMEGLIDHLVTYNRINKSKMLTLKGHKEYYQAELELNDKLRVFAVNCSLLYGGYNSVQAQLKIKSKREYTEIGGDEELPLGEEFQEHLKRFIKTHEKKLEKRLELVKKLVTQLAISWEMYPKLTSESLRIEQEELDIRSLQLLRAIIHNEERKLPENWEEDPSAHRKHLNWIRSIQVELNEMEAVKKALPHLARPCDRVAKEVLAFVSVMLFNANEPVQTSLLTYFWQTREESFFAAIRTRIHLSALAIKEKRSLAAQQRARAKEALSQTKTLQAGMLAGKRALKEIQAVDMAIKRQKYSQGRQASLSTLQCKTAKKKKMEESKKEVTKEKRQKRSVSEENLLNDEKSIKTDDMKKSISSDLQGQKIQNETKNIPNGISISKSPEDVDSEDEKSVQQQEAAKDEDDFEDFEQKDDGFIKLVLSLLARMCDGQHAGLQDYLREQPDNLKSFNIIAETAQFVNLVYSNITAQNIDLCIQLFETLNEFTVGNQQNRSMMLNSKVVDYVNFILRAAEFKNCDQQDVLTLKLTIGNLIMSMIEENTPESLLVAKETKDTLDKEALYRCMTACYDACRPERSKVKSQKATTKGELGVSQVPVLPMSTLPPTSKEPPKKLDPDMKELLDETGFVYYLIIARLYDLDPKLCKKEQLTIPLPQLEAFNYYKKNTMSIEVIKDDCLQKINFRVKNKNVLREEVKEKMIWNVDRSSPSNKIRDMMKWSKDILKDIYYQRRILSNPFATFFTKQWVMWNQIVIMLSVAINILMLVTWNARASLADVQIPKNATSVPERLYDPLPKIDLEQYDVILLVLGISHNVFCSIVLITYFLSNHPTLPKISVLGEKIRQICRRSKTEEEEEEKNHQSKLEVHFFSFTTFYYLLFLCMSVLGTIFKGYFFAFHLVNIVNNNQLLKGVIQAVTQNGKSLLWVAVLGFVVFYLYGLVSFALLRSSFDPDNDLYCATLWQCTVTVIRYGLVGQLFDKLNSHPAENTFSKFGILVIFHLSFFIFITTIGLNIIFGIIVDTFSELRDLKWTAERDMRDTCFICSRGSYDFEHHGMGFDYHINYEHDIWAYLFFFIHLHDTKQCDYTSLELYIFRLLSQEKFDFFPLNRALSLSVMDEGSTDSKIDDLLRYVISMVDRQREEDAKTKREEERQKQLRWREENRSALLLGRSQTDPGEEGHFGSNVQKSRKLRHTKAQFSHDSPLFSDKSRGSADEFQEDYDDMTGKEDSPYGSDIRSPRDKWQAGSINYENEENYPGVTTLESRNSSIIAPTDFQEDYNGKALLHLNLEKIASRRSDISSHQSDLDRMSSIEESGNLIGPQSPRESIRSGSVNRMTPMNEDNGEALLTDPFQIRRPSSSKLSDQHSHFSSTDV